MTRTNESSRKKESQPKDSKDSNDPPKDDTERYRKAAEDALQQLDWAIGYLHGIGKTSVSRSLARNRSYIRQHLMGEAEESLPTQETSET